MAVCSLNTSSIWTDSEFGNSIRNGSSPEAGSGRVFLYRSWRKYRKKSWLVFVPSLLLFLGGWWAIRYHLESLYALTLLFERWLSRIMPDWVRWVLEKIVGRQQLSSGHSRANVRRLDCLVALCCYVSDVRGDATDDQAMGSQGLSVTDR